MRSLLLSILLLDHGAYAITVPASTPPNASQQLEAAPVGVSIEFFTFPDYMTVVASTKTCLANLGALSGVLPPLRIGGTTQDRATYDPNLASAVSYTVASPTDAPTALTFGPSYMTLAGTYAGNITMGLNRELNNLSNTIAAAKLSVSDIKTLYAIELGNEPDLYSTSSPIADGSWSQVKDIDSQVSWQASVGAVVGSTSIIQAGVYLQPPTWATANLAPKEGSSAQYVKSFSGHSYPQSACSGATTNLKTLMSHPGIVTYTKQYATEAAAAKAIDKPYVLGETNSATCGGGGISPTFGAALWIVDYTFQALLAGATRLYFHQGTIGNCQYCWWDNYGIGAPYYGAYMAAAALAGTENIAMLDTGSSAYAVYALYTAGKPTKLVLYNSDYYSSGTRSYYSFSIDGLSTSINSVTAKRLTAPAATSRQDQGGNPSFGGQMFTNGTCAITGTAELETTAVGEGKATFSVAASEALLVYLTPRKLS